MDLPAVSPFLIIRWLSPLTVSPMLAFACRSLIGRARYRGASRFTRPPIPCAAGSPLRHFHHHHQVSLGRQTNKSASFAMEGASNNATTNHKKIRRSPVQQIWRPISTEAVSQKDDVHEIRNPGREQVIETSLTASESSASGGTTTNVVIQVDAPLMRFVKGKGGSMQKQIEEETGVKIIFPSSKEETSVVLEGKSAESIKKASEKIVNVLEQAVQSRMLDYSHFISLPLAIHLDLVDKLNHFQRSILGASASEEDSDKDESLSDGSIDEMDHVHKLADSSSVSVKLHVQEEEEAVKVKINTKGSLQEFGIDKSIFIKPRTFHLTVLMLKLWNKDRIDKASDVLQSISSQVNEALGNRPISIQLKGLTCMKGSPAKARVVYAPVLEVGEEGRLVRACKIIIDAFVKSGLVLERDAKQELKLHATIMNARHRKSKKRNRWNDSFDARDIFRKYGEEEWGEYHIPEVHLSQRFKFDECGYYHCCSCIPLPAEMQTERGL